MQNVTIDTNCIIDLEEARSTATAIRKLIELHQAGKIRLRVVGISASERKKDGTYAANFAEFKEKLAAVGLSDVEILKPMAYADICFFDWSVFSGEDMEAQERQIHDVLFPNIEFEHAEYIKKHPTELGMRGVAPKWRNAKCDVQAMWCHIANGGGIFVTSDGNFHRSSKKVALTKLGAGRILYPEEAVRIVT